MTETTAAEIGFPSAWVFLAILGCALVLAIRAEVRRAERDTAWHDEATLLYAEGCVLGDAIRTAAASEASGQPVVWEQLESPTALLAVRAHRLTESAPGSRRRDRTTRLADEASSLNGLVRARSHPSDKPLNPIRTAVVAYDAALLELRAAL